MDKNFLVFYFFFSFNNTWVTLDAQVSIFFLLFTQCQSLMQCVKLSISIFFFFFFCHELTSCDIVLKGLNIFNLLLTHDFVLK